MTAAFFIIAGVMSHWYWQTYGWFLMEGPLAGMTFYVAWFIAVLALACVWAVKSLDPRCIIAAVVLVLNFAASHWGWLQMDKVLAQVAIDTGCAAFFVLWGRERWEWGIASVYLISALAGAAAHFGFIPGPSERAPVFLALAYADITSLCGHLASIILGLAAGDWGKRVRTGAIKPAPWAAEGSLLMRIAGTVIPAKRFP